MAKKLTYEEVKEYIESQGYELLSEEYINAHSKLTIQDGEGYLYSVTWERLKLGQEPFMAHLSNPYSIYNIKKYALQFGYELISTEYKNSKKDKLQFKCPKCKEIFDATWDNFQHGHRCPYCCNSPQKIKLGVNTIWDTDRWMIEKLGISEEDAKTHMRCSNDKIQIICPNCGKNKEVRISDIYVNKSNGCSCNDSISYPEKFIVSLLDQLGIKYEREYKPKWSNNKRYDFYLPDYSIILECHGRQHYEEQKRKGARTLEEEQKNDKYKKELALNNGISSYIVLDCRFSELSWIEQSITNSELSNIFDLSKIDLLKCQDFAINSNLIKEVCDCWNNKEEWETITDLANKFNISNATIRNWLKRGKLLGLCDTYNPKKELRKGASKSGKANGKPVQIFKDEKLLGAFPSCSELEKQSEKLFGVKLLHGNISAVCRGEKPQYKGFTFRYITKEEYESRIS